MDYLRIGDNKLKITMTAEELLFYGMDLSTLSYSSTETRRAFWAILDDAKHATGFDAAATRVSVQVYACRTGGCEMYIIGEEREQSLSTDAELAAYPSDSDKEEIESALTVCPALPRLFGRAMGEFRRLSDLLAACLALSACGYNADSSAWQADDHYYLYLDGNRGGKTKDEPALSASAIIAEFGETVKDLSLSYLAEHGRCLCGHHAVEQLGILVR